MRLIETDSLSNQNIASALSIGSYTATAVRGVIVRVLVNQVAGNGDYIIYATLTKSAVEYRMIPITTAAAASGLTSIAFVSLPIPVDVGDVLQVYLDGLAGDTTTPDTRVDFYEQDYLRPTVTGRTLDVASTGEAGLDFANINAASAPTTLTNITVPTVTTTATATSVTNTVTANLTQILGTALSEGVAGYLAAAFKKLFNVATPVLTSESVNQTGDSYAVVTNATYGNSALHTDIAALGGGAGAITYTFTVNDGTNPIDGVEVWVSTNIAGTNVVAGTKTTDALGQVVFTLDAGTYYAWLQRAGYNFTNPTSFVVS